MTVDGRGLPAVGHQATGGPRTPERELRPKPAVLEALGL